MPRKKKEEVKPKAKPKAKAKAKAKPKAKVEPKKKVGRPSKFNTIDMAQVEKLIKAGFTNEQMADFFEVRLSTWNSWKKNNESFLDAIKDWRLEADKEIEKSLRKRAMGYSYIEEMEEDDNGRVKKRKTKKQVAPETAAIIFWLKNRQPQTWRDKRENTFSGPDGGAIKVNKINLVAPDDE